MLKRSGNFVFEVKIALALAAIFLSTAANSAYAAERNLRVSYSAPATAFLPLWAAKDAGIFDRNNLTVELLYVGSSPIALAALLSDELDVLAGGGTAAPTAYLQGFRDLALFSTLDHRFAFKIFTVPSIVDIAGLRGKRFGVTRGMAPECPKTLYLVEGDKRIPRKMKPCIKKHRTVSGAKHEAITVQPPWRFGIVLKRVPIKHCADFRAAEWQP